MQFINALSLAPAGNDWLANSCEPHVLHVFENACNLINERKDVLSIVTPQIGNGPFNLVVANNIRFSNSLNLESAVVISQKQLVLGSLNISIADTKLWSSHPDWEKLHTKRFEILDQLTHFLIREKHGSLDSCFREYSGLLNHRVLSIPQSLVSKLSLALVDVDVFSAQKLAAKLAGLGVGLTPAGDDFIMGALYAVWIIHPPEVVGFLSREIVNTAAPLTTSLSAAWLKAAGRGEAGVLWHEFFDALVLGNTQRIHETTKNILAVGETSGADALAGFTSVFTVWMKSAGATYE